MQTRRPSQFRRTLLCIAMSAVLAILAAAVLASAASAQTADGGPYEPEFPSIEIIEKTVQGKFGGGDFIGIHNKDRDSMIGVLYGTDSNPNNVYLVSVFTRYLGTADVYENGEKIESDHPIPVYTLFAQRFAGIYEFDDSNGDGMYDGRRTGGNGTDIITRETVFKKVNTYAAWEASEVSEIDTGNDTKEWTFSLTTRDMNYKHPWGLWNKFNMRNERLEAVTISFHLYVQRDPEAQREVPVWKVEVSSRGDGNYDVGESTSLGTRTYKGESVEASFKYDTLIDGWEYDNGNANPALLWSTQLMFANAVSDEVYDWLTDNFLTDIQGQGGMSYQTGGGRTELNAASAGGSTMDLGGAAGSDIQTENPPQLIMKNRLSCADNWQNIGHLSWVSDVEVDGSDDEMYFQVYGALGFTLSDPDRGAVTGFLANAGFSYPGGSRVYHDPTFSAAVFQITPEDDRDFRFGLVLVLLIFVVVAVIAVVVIAGLVKLSAGGRAKPEHELDSDDRNGGQDYYETYYMDKKK